MVSLYLGILTSCEVVAEAVSPYPVQHFVEQFSGMSTTTPTCVDYRLHCRNFSVPTKETIQVYSHLGTHATLAVNSSKLEIVTVTYECSEPSSDMLP